MHDVAGTVVQPTLGAALRQATADLRRAGIEGPGDDARRLLAAVLSLSAAQLLGRPERPLSAEEIQRLDRCIARRVAREPVSRILGTRDFYGRSFAISPATLDPRPASETLIEATLELAAQEGWATGSPRPLRILDVGTGSGCLLLTLLAELPNAQGVGTDRSAAALQVAWANAERLGVAGRAQWLVADALEPVRGPFDILISNPPYIPTDQIARLAPEVCRYDPGLALDGGPDGLRFFHRLVGSIPSVVPDGWVVLEVGHDQADAVTALLGSQLPVINAADIRIYRDVAGRRRCVAARTRN
jgi:release factor glutamine methyltransferase